MRSLRLTAITLGTPTATRGAAVSQLRLGCGIQLYDDRLLRQIVGRVGDDEVSMRISFDLDDTLICYGANTPCEPRPLWLWRMLTTGEPLRQGARLLMQTLSIQGCDLWIYTTSPRSPASVRLWLWSYGIWVRRVVNRDAHDRELRRVPHAFPPSKNPAAFGIDLHVDDSEGVRIEGDRHGFRVVVVAPEDESWATKVLSAVDEIRHRT